MIKKETIHPEGDNSVDIYPKTSFDQVEGRPDMSEYQLKSGLESDIEELGFNKVLGNPNETGTINLVKIKIGNNVYLIPQGTVVEANPAETGLTNLTKIKIGSTVYNIPSGGSAIYAHYILCSATTNNNVALSNVEICLLSNSSTPIENSYDLMSALNSNAILVSLCSTNSPYKYFGGIYFGLAILLTDGDYISLTGTPFANVNDHYIFQL